MRTYGVRRTCPNFVQLLVGNMRIYLAGHAGFSESKKGALYKWTRDSIRAGLATNTMFSFSDIKANQRGDHFRFKFMAKNKRNK